MDSFQLPPALTVSRQLDQEKLSLLTERAEKLKISNNQLRADTLRSEKATEDMAAHYQKELAKRAELIESLQGQLEIIKTENSRAMDRMRNHYENEIYNLKSTLDYNVREISEKLNKAENELNLLDIFRKEKDLHDNKINAFEMRLENQKKDFEVEKNELETKFITEKFRLIREHEEHLKSLRNNALDDAHDLLRGQQKTILSENERLYTDLKMHVATSESLEKERDAFAAECEELRRAVELAREKERTSGQLGHAKNAELKKLRTRVEELEAQLRDSTRSFTRQNTELKATLGKDLEDTTLDAAGLRTLLKYKNKELKNMKSLAATILNQRSDVEAFFLQALQDVRERIQRDKKERTTEEKRLLLTKMKTGNIKPSKIRVRKIVSGESDTAEMVLPKLHVKATNLKYWDGVEGSQPVNQVFGRDFVKDLSWEEKESVLRSLFAKMNGKDLHLSLASEIKAYEEERQQMKLRHSEEYGGADLGEASSISSADYEDNNLEQTDI